MREDEKKNAEPYFKDSVNASVIEDNLFIL